MQINRKKKTKLSLGSTLRDKPCFHRVKLSKFVHLCLLKAEEMCPRGQVSLHCPPVLCRLPRCFAFLCHTYFLY